ncbi:MAG: BlaI/MecI/CopY family transcriptional regulator [Flavobacteriales bacterium]|nr:BlaI/MecI/CopY family transcriptional regulator [Flavobacteriales bacterium]
MKRLTRAEEQIMLVLWKKGQAFVKEVLEELPEPKPAYNTVSTVVRILEQKGFVKHEVFGRSHRYEAIISQEEYSGSELDKMVTDHFNGSVKQMLSFFVEKKSMSVKDLDEVLKKLQTKNKKS